MAIGILRYFNFPEKLLQLWTFGDSHVIFHNQLVHQTLDDHGENVDLSYVNVSLISEHYKIQMYKR